MYAPGVQHSLVQSHHLQLPSPPKPPSIHHLTSGLGCLYNFCGTKEEDLGIFAFELMDTNESNELTKVRLRSITFKF